jgi:O-antigen polymerase
MFLKKPLLGWGLSGFEQNYLYHQATFFKGHPTIGVAYKIAAANVVNSFNEFVMLLVRTGLAGLTVFIALLVLAFRIARRGDKGDKCFPFLTLLLILCSALFYYSFHITFLLVIAEVAMVSLASGLKPAATIPKNAGRLLLTVVGSFLLLALSYCVKQQYATKKWHEADLRISHAANLSWPLFREAYPTLRHRSAFLYNYGAELYRHRHYRECIPLLEECAQVEPSVDQLLYLGKARQLTGNPSQAEACFVEAANIVPMNLTPKYFLVQLYMADGRTEAALSLAKEIMHIPVKVPSSEAESIRSEMDALLKTPEANFPGK